MRAKSVAAVRARGERLVKAAIGAAVLATLLAGVVYAQHMARNVANAGPVYLAKVVELLPWTSDCERSRARDCGMQKEPQLRAPAWAISSFSL